MTRMQAVAGGWTSGNRCSDGHRPAAILGAIDDGVVAAADPVVVLNVGTSTPSRPLPMDAYSRHLRASHRSAHPAVLEHYLEQLATGALSNDQVFDDMATVRWNSCNAFTAETIGRHRSAPRSARRLAAPTAPRGAARRHDAAGCSGWLRALAARLPDSRRLSKRN